MAKKEKHPETELPTEVILIIAEAVDTVNKNVGLASKRKLTEVPSSTLVLLNGLKPKMKQAVMTLFKSLLEQGVKKTDVTKIISEYIGETEKNLTKLFSTAKKKDAILFFDEADALFGKRTSVNDAHDKYANQEVSYLLGRLEEFKGLIILSTTKKVRPIVSVKKRFQFIIG